MPACVIAQPKRLSCKSVKDADVYGMLGDEERVALKLKIITHPAVVVEYNGFNPGTNPLILANHTDYSRKILPYRLFINKIIS